MTRSSLPVGTLAELLAAARAKPGGLTYASSGSGTPHHMTGELLKALAGVAGARDADAARRFIALLAGAGSRALQTAGGFEP